MCDWRVQTGAGSLTSVILQSKPLDSGYGPCLTSSLDLDGLDIAVFFGGTIAWPRLGGLRVYLDSMHTTYHSEGTSCATQN